MPLHCTSQGTCWGILLTFLIGGFVDCQLIISIPGSSTVNGNVGDDITLRIEYSGAANPTVEWTKSALPIATWIIGSSVPPEIAPAFGTVRLKSDGSLTFQNVQPQHSGQYTVRLSKSGVGTATAMFTLRVFDPIKDVSISAAPEEIREGSSAFSLQYSTLRGDVESVKWLFKGTEIKNGTRYIISDKSLKVNNPTRADSGQYSVVLTNPVDSATAHKDISVLFGPEQPVLKVVPQKDAYEVGDSLTATCGAEGDPAPSVSWALDGKPLPVSAGGTLNLTNIKTKESGVYTCVLVNNVTGSRLERNVTINIYDFIQNVSISAAPEEIREGSSAFSLQYSTLLGDTESVKWLFKGTEIKNGTRYTISDKSLKVNSPTRADSGRYSVVLTNPLGSATAHKDISVLYGPDLPVLKVVPQKDAYEVGDSLTATCGAEGDPAPSVSWAFDGKPLPVSPGGTLNLANIKTKESGVYTCVLVNNVTGSRLERNITINIYENPTGSPECSVSIGGNASQFLQYRCKWLGGTPQAQLSFPALNASHSGMGDFILPVTPRPDLNGKEISCEAHHPLGLQKCSVTAQSPIGSPECSVAIGGNVNQFLQYRCKWLGGTPQAQLSFPALDASGSGMGDFILPVTPRPDLNGKEISCEADYALGLQKCSVTARGPDGSIPVVSSGVDSNGLVVVDLTCASTSMPIATVTWFKGGQVITSGDQYQISPNTTVLTLRDPVLNTSNLGIYSCKAANLLGQSDTNVQLLGPKISTSSLVTEEGGTVVTLTWATPPASIVTGFEVQMAGPDLKPRSAGSQRRKRATDTFRTIQTLSATARSTELGLLEPFTAYKFRVIPFAGHSLGEPSKEHHVGPGGVNEAAIAGIATEVICGFLLLLLLLL